MASSNRQLTAQARQSLQGQWTLAVGVNFLYGLVNSVGNEVNLIIGGPMQMGLSRFSLNLARGKKADIEQLFDGFKSFANTLVAYLLMVLYVLLWALLLIVPGIIAAIAYSQTFFILSDNPEMKGWDALRKSKAMMNGYKWKYFCLCWRFFGWFLLSILSLGVGFLFLFPYAHVSFAHFYDDIKK